MNSILVLCDQMTKMAPLHPLHQIYISSRIWSSSSRILIVSHRGPILTSNFWSPILFCIGSPKIHCFHPQTDHQTKRRIKLSKCNSTSSGLTNKTTDWNCCLSPSLTTTMHSKNLPKCLTSSPTTVRATWTRSPVILQLKRHFCHIRNSIKLHSNDIIKTSLES